MTKTWVQLSDSQRDIAQRDFINQSATGDLLDAAARESEVLPKGQSRAAYFRALYRIATGPDPITEELDRALRADPGLQADFRALIGRAAGYAFPMAAAASSGEVENRTGAGCDIAIKQSRAEPGQVYVLLTLKADAPMEPKTLFVARPGGDFIKQPLPDPTNGVIQILTDGSAPLIEALKDTKAEVYLQ